MTNAFKDHFSGHAALYRRARPGYPTNLYQWILARLPAAERISVWDCATGNGQVAVDIAPWVDEVIATDASAQQIAAAIPHPKVEYRVASAEDCGLTAGSVHWVIVAQALHWFDQDKFYSEAQRVLKAGGVLSAWTYRQVQVSADVDAVIERLYNGILGDYWPDERRMVEAGYRGILPAWPTVASPLFETACDWTMAQLVGYLQSWSATQRYCRATGKDPISPLLPALTEAYGPLRRRVRWPIVLHVFRRPD